MTAFSALLRRGAARLAAVALLALAAVGAAPGDARALNVPGSVGGDFILDTIFYAVDDVSGLAQNGGGLNVTGGGYELASISPQAGSQFDGFIAQHPGTDWGISATFDYRHLDLDSGGLDLDYNMFVGSLAFGYAVDENLTLLGGGIAEYGFGESDFNSGTIFGVGFGLFAGAVYTVDQNWTLTGIAGAQRLNFDVERANGTIMGNFDANRYFAAAEVDYRANSGPVIYRFGAGLRYVYQDSDSYTETGPGGVFVPSIEEEVFSLAARGKVAYALGDGLTPFTQLDFTYDVVNDTSTPAGFATLSNSRSDWSLHTQLGVEFIPDENVRLLAQAGPFFSGDGFDGVSLRLNAQIRF